MVYRHEGFDAGSRELLPSFTSDH
jgi:hypothetical protein